jgi:hypothetical protein
MHVTALRVWVSPACISEALHFEPKYSLCKCIKVVHVGVVAPFQTCLRQVSKWLEQCLSGESNSSSVLQEISKTFYGTQWFMILFKTTSQWTLSRARQIQARSSPMSIYNSNRVLHLYLMSPKWLIASYFPTKRFYVIHRFPCILNFSLISFFSAWYLE